MLFPLSLVLSSFFLPATCQLYNTENGFHPDPLTTGTFALLCIFAVAFGILSIVTFVVLLTARGHRTPYALLLPTLALFSLSNDTYIALLVLENISDLYLSDSYPALLLPAISFVSNLFNNWAVVLQFLVVIAVVWNRESVLRTATEGKFGGHHPAVIALHVALATLTFIFGTAAEALNMATNVQYYTTDTFSSDDGTLQHRLVQYQQLNYVYASFAILTAVDVIVSAVLLWRAWRKAVIPDRITALVLFAIVPVYGAFSLVLMVFTILFSPSGISDSASITVFEGANLANNLLATLLSITIMIIILAMSSKKAHWNAGGIADPPKQYWAPQPEYVYAAPPQVTHAGYYVAPPSQAQTPHYAGPPQQPYPGSYTPGSPEHMQYAPPDESRPGSYAPGSPPPMEVGPGSYSPPQSAQGRPVQFPDKGGPPPHGSPGPYAPFPFQFNSKLH
ncbi:hypothetical protein DFH07DRAFT_1062620 [Mycena maculata]|uniref:Uncharacterized protein n=1 Tax=Mycena maculata TaxID=230809 RepID=A0AAD7N6G5_9AGAR|nr:hypothetical protein DFH07DRAFT_1062620 [Mycena maculata]